MKILVTGANGFIGKNLIAELKNQKFSEIYECDLDTKPELLEKYLEEYTSDINLLTKNIDNIVSVKSEIEEFKNRFNKVDFKKFNDLMKDSKKVIIDQLSLLNFKKTILNSDSILDEYNNFSFLLDNNFLKGIKKLIHLIDVWNSEGFLYYTPPNENYNGMFFNSNERMFWQTSMSSFCEEINLLLKSHLEDIRLPTKSLRHNTQPHTGYIIHFDDLKNWLLAKNN